MIKKAIRSDCLKLLSKGYFNQTIGLLNLNTDDFYSISVPLEGNPRLKVILSKDKDIKRNIIANVDWKEVEVDVDVEIVSNFKK